MFVFIGMVKRTQIRNAPYYLIDRSTLGSFFKAFRIWAHYHTDHFILVWSSDQFAVNKQFEPFQCTTLWTLLNSSTANHVKNRIWSDPEYVNDYDLDERCPIPTVPINECFKYQSRPINEHTQVVFVYC
jgi:hypothetical protein